MDKTANIEKQIIGQRMLAIINDFVLGGNIAFESKHYVLIRFLITRTGIKKIANKNFLDKNAFVLIYFGFSNRRRLLFWAIKDCTTSKHKTNFK